MLGALVLALAPSCARHPAPAVVDPATLPPLPRSSLAAVILHRAELGLTDDQVRELEQLDRRRESEDAAVRAELGPKSKTANAGTGAGTPSGGVGAASAASAAPAGGAGGGMNGGGMGGGRMGGMRGGRMGGGRGFRAPGSTGPNQTQRSARLEDRLDDDDTKAYLDGEEVLTEPQREQAREIASDYRAQLYDRRELLRHKAPPEKP